MEIRPLPARRSFNCYSGCVTALLERKGWLYSEPVAVGLCRGLNLEFTAEGPLHYRGVRELHCITEYLENRGLAVARHVEHDPIAFDALVARHIASDQPTMIEYDGYYLPFTQIHLRRHERRIGLVVGLNENHYWLTDPIYGVEGAMIPRELLLQSRSPALGAAVEPGWYEVSMVGSARPGAEDAVASVVETAEYFQTEQSGSKLRGVPGARRFAERASDRLQASRDTEALEEFSEELKQGSILFDHYGEFLRVAPVLWPLESGQLWEAASQSAAQVAAHLRLAAALVWKSKSSDPKRCGERLTQVVDHIADKAAILCMTLQMLGHRNQRA